jgi:hypothetical protein
MVIIEFPEREKAEAFWVTLKFETCSRCATLRRRANWYLPTGARNGLLKSRHLTDAPLTFPPGICRLIVASRCYRVGGALARDSPRNLGQ